jgi:hypothetical protein
MSNVKTVDGFARIVDIYTGIGGINPGRPNLQKGNLVSLFSQWPQGLEQREYRAHHC